ncbi:MAG: hypothetical protein IT332_06785 [Ardenticatenales bacterium]|nr:hypothetical protein [Ardenticatenales bacterium]
MHPPAFRPDRRPIPFAHAALFADGDAVDGRAEALDMALAARAADVSDDVVAAAFGPEAARLARFAAALDGLAPPPPPAAPFVAALETRLGRAFDARPVASHRARLGHGPSVHRFGLVARMPGVSELALAAAVVLALGTAAVHDGWRPAPALAATPTTTIHRTQTPLGPTGTATGGTPAAMATVEPVEPVAMAKGSAEGSAEGSGRVGW